MLRKNVMLGVLLLAGPAFAEEGDPGLAAALLKCPGAAPFVEADRLRAEERKNAHTDAALSEPALRQQLLDMAQVDQEARQGEWTRAMVENLQAVDGANLPRIKQIVTASGGLPSAAQVGGDGVSAAWLLVQHADADVVFQRQVLGSIEPMVQRGEISAHDFALLTDRVLVNSGELQRYGSQLLAVDGRWQSKPMESPDQVDQRRASIGQMPLADYICVATQMFPTPPAAAK
ncbi:DUF6624 domain-containing protein [uncultured Stenotrophomonas sp.]|uniref:DUF6624 domain-containing protein n=1 Tax=uncultured Stenotrophomonas sp. TaxID=165438 RepID=UPI0025F71540|nr:DUF6624 domain-containing protein [uncultured Stenotrophomonas sp.]